MATKNSDIKSMNMIKNRMKLAKSLEIKNLKRISPVSPNDSESSSGFGSLSPKFRTSTSKFLATTSASDTPNKNTTANVKKTHSEENKKLPEKNAPIQVMYRGRDILNLGANLRGASQHAGNPRKHNCGTQTLCHLVSQSEPITNHSAHFRLDKNNAYVKDYLKRVYRN